jgi:hypothetical protein
MKGIFTILCMVFLLLFAVDYVKPLGMPVVSEYNPLPWVEGNILGYISGQEASNIVDLSDYNLDFEQGTIGWHLHYLYSVPPDYWEATFEDAKSGRMSLRLAHSCDSTDNGNLRSVQSEQCLFRTDKLPSFDNNIYVKFYIKSLRNYENAWWQHDLFDFQTLTTYSLNVEAIDEWGERIYTKDIISDIYTAQNSQLVKIVQYDFSNNVSAEDYFKKINAIDYNATIHGSLDQIQVMIDMQNSMSKSTVYYYVANTNELPKSSYAVYLGDGWYTVIMPVPKDIRYLGFDSHVYCSGQNEGWAPSGFGGYWYFPDAPAIADTLTYIDGITFIKAITNADVAVPSTTTVTNDTTNNWSDDISDTGDTSTSESLLTKLVRWLLFFGIIFILIILAFPKKTDKFRRKLGINKVEKGVKKMAPRTKTSNTKPIFVEGHYRAHKGESSKGGLL